MGRRADAPTRRRVDASTLRDFLWRLRTSNFDHLRPSNFARIAAKLRENAFRTICNFRFFDAENFFFEIFSRFFSLFRDFRAILEELGIFWRQNQLLHQILLQIHPSWGLYDQKLGFRRLRTEGLSFFEHNEWPSSTKQHRRVIRVITLITLFSSNTEKTLVGRFREKLPANFRWNFWPNFRSNFLPNFRSIF